MADERPHRPTVPGRDSGERRNGELASTHDRLHEQIELLRSQLGSELSAARLELEACRVEAERLRERLSNFECEHRRVCEGYSTLERQIGEMANLYVAMERIHSTVDRREVLAAVQDIVINIIGSEELALFELPEGGRELYPVQCFGVEDRHLGPVPLASGPIGRAAAERWSWIVGDGPPPKEYPDLTACVPFEVDGRVTGVLAIWRMLGHKPLFGEIDRQVLHLLASHAAIALYLTSLRERPQTRAA